MAAPPRRLSTQGPWCQIPLGTFMSFIESQTQWVKEDQKHIKQVVIMIWLISVVYTGLLTSQRVAYESVSVIIVQSTCISYLSSLDPCRTARFAVILYAKIVQCLRLNGCFVYSRKQGNTVSLLFVSAALFTAVTKETLYHCCS